jgi:alkanesulfonate monooxygenase
MTTEYTWFIPSARAGDGHKINLPTPERAPTIEFLSKLARTAEEAGFINLLVLHQYPLPRRLGNGRRRCSEHEPNQILVAFRPGLASPVYAAPTCNALDWTTNGRVTVNVVTGYSPAEKMRYGDTSRTTNTTNVGWSISIL